MRFEKNDQSMVTPHRIVSGKGGAKTSSEEAGTQYRWQQPEKTLRCSKMMSNTAWRAESGLFLLRLMRDMRKL